MHLRDLTTEQKIKIISLTTDNNSLNEKITSLEDIESKHETALFSYIKKKYPKTSKIVAKEIASQTATLCNELGAPFIAIVGIMEVESAFNPMATSSKYAAGLMQVMPNIWVKEFEYLNNTPDLHEIDLGIRAGIEIYLIYLAGTGDHFKALSKYVGGSTGDYQNKVYKAISDFTFHIIEQESGVALNKIALN